MSRNIGPTVEILVRRVRQSGGLAVDVDFATQILTTCQQILNAYLKKVTTTESLTTKKEKLVYSFSDLTAPLDILEITESNRSLRKCETLSEFSGYELNWFRNITGTRFEAWCQIARDAFVIYPAKASDSSVSVEYVTATTIYSDFSTYYNTALVLADEDIEHVLKLSEIVLSLSGRKFINIQSAINRFAADLGVPFVSK